MPTPAPALRAMQAADVDPATEMVLGAGWGVRREWFAFAVTQPACLPIVAELDGRLVATGVGTANGPAGWIGSIFVEPGHRGRGLGRALTQAIIDGLEAGGCRTLVLVATSDGRRLYERMGFEVQTHYRILEALGLAADEGSAPEAGQGHGQTRPFEARDLPAVVELDRRATGEDRLHVLERLATAESTKVFERPGGGVEGFVVRAPWGGGATVASSTPAALEVIAARRRAAGPTGRTRVGVLAENEAGMDAVLALGFQPQWTAPRMIRGADLAWQPDLIWGQFNHAMG